MSCTILDLSVRATVCHPPCHTVYRQYTLTLWLRPFLVGTIWHYCAKACDLDRRTQAQDCVTGRHGKCTHFGSVSPPRHYLVLTVRTRLIQSCSATYRVSECNNGVALTLVYAAPKPSLDSLARAVTGLSVSAVTTMGG